jgi:hypothetical protein
VAGVPPPSGWVVGGEVFGGAEVVGEVDGNTGPQSIVCTDDAG